MNLLEAIYICYKEFKIPMSVRKTVELCQKRFWKTKCTRKKKATCRLSI